MKNDNEIDKILSELKSETDEKPAESIKKNNHLSENFYKAAEKTVFDYEENGNAMEKPAKSKNKAVIAIVAVIAVIAVICGVYFGFFFDRGDDMPQTSDVSATEPVSQIPAAVLNPLTGETGYNKSALGKRPVSVVVDNASGARPQYNIDKADLIVEGEVEGGETRMLWFFSDMTNLPEQIGPTRSARPSFVEFSQFFDSVYVHFGGSHSKGDYIGGYEVIKNNNVDDIDGMSVSSCFRRTSDKTSPHNAALIGNKLVAAIEKKNYRTDIDENSFSALSFNEQVQPLSDTVCSNAAVKISSKTNTHKLTYNSLEQVYINQSDYKTPVSFTNVIVMYANSKYIDKSNYKGSGKTETYLNYDFTNGSGKLISYGTAVDFTWNVTNGKLSFKDANGNDLKLNPGKSWIALASANNGGTVTLS